MTPLEHFSHCLLNAEQDFSTAFTMVNGIRESLQETVRAPGEVLLAGSLNVFFWSKADASRGRS